MSKTIVSDNGCMTIRGSSGNTMTISNTNGTWSTTTWPNVTGTGTHTIQGTLYKALTKEEQVAEILSALRSGELTTKDLQMFLDSIRLDKVKATITSKLVLYPVQVHRQPVPEMEDVIKQALSDFELDRVLTEEGQP